MSDPLLRGLALQDPAPGADRTDAMFHGDIRGSKRRAIYRAFTTVRQRPGMRGVCRQAHVPKRALDVYRHQKDGL